MDDTRAVARLPHLEVEIVHRRLPEAEQLAISPRAPPSLEAFVRHLEAQAALWPWLALNPWLGWYRLLHATWQPWLTAAERSMSAGAAPRPVRRDG